MKSLLTIFTCVILFCQLTVAQTLDRSIRPKPGPTPEVQIPQPVSFTLDNGLKVFVIENHKIPKVSMLIRFDFMPPLEKNMTGLNQFVGDIMMSGTTKKNKEEINKTIDGLGATLNFSSNSIYASSLTRHINEIMGLTSEILLKPNPSQAELDLLKEQAIDGIQSQKDDPDAQVNNASAVMAFGKNHPYGEIPTAESYGNITLDACKQYASNYFRPNVAYMAIVGDITPAKAKELVKKHFNEWKSANVPKMQYASKPLPTSTQVVFVNKPSAVQSNFEITYPISLQPGSTDDVPSSVMNYILGGGSSSKLFMNLREGHGWTYGAYSSTRPDRLVGSFSAGAKCRNSVTDSAIAETLKEMNNLINKKFTDDELKAAKSYLAGSFGRSLENPQTVANYYINMKMYNLPSDYYQNYLKTLSRVDNVQVQRMASKYLKPDNAYIVVSGNRDETMATLAKFDKDNSIEELDYLGNVPAKSNVQIDANMTAEQVVEDYINAVGGRKIWSSIKDMSVEANASLGGMQLQMKQYRKSPDKLRMEVLAGGNVVQKQVVNGKKGYMNAQGQTMDLEGENLESLRESANIQLELNYVALQYQLQLKGTELVNGKDAYVIQVTAPNGSTSTDYYDVKTHYKIRTIQVVKQEGEVATNTNDYDNYKDIGNGFKMPFKNVITSGPQIIDFEVQKVQVNTGLADSFFE